MGHCSSAALLAMVALTLLTTTHGINNNSSGGGRDTWCDGLSDPSCLIANSDLDGMEFLMDSEINRRILAGYRGVTGPALDPSKAASCDRRGFPPCHPGSNRNPPAPNCDQTSNVDRRKTQRRRGTSRGNRGWSADLHGLMVAARTAMVVGVVTVIGDGTGHL
ncbi:hypothetical protein L3X38_027138 [Prunus dulcis]|uniref:Uncharacterized protein n=1 Tax=Prunus dulcis TaxID=3755 RepID=A0AAD4YZ61_PRUDU|nr:hypothetical protein L3X38_027138 [Prunus dulcis]